MWNLDDNFLRDAPNHLLDMHARIAPGKTTKTQLYYASCPLYHLMALGTNGQSINH